MIRSNEVVVSWAEGRVVWGPHLQLGSEVGEQSCGTEPLPGGSGLTLVGELWDI